MSDRDRKYMALFFVLLSLYVLGYGAATMKKLDRIETAIQCEAAE